MEEKNSGGSGPPSKLIIRAPKNTGAGIYVNLKDIPDSNERVCSGRYLHGRTAVQLKCPRPQALPRALRFWEMSATWPFVAQVTQLLLFGDAFVHRRRPSPQGPRPAGTTPPKGPPHHRDHIGDHHRKGHRIPLHRYHQLNHPRNQHNQLRDQHRGYFVRFDSCSWYCVEGVGTFVLKA